MVRSAILTIFIIPVNEGWVIWPCWYKWEQTTCDPAGHKVHWPVHDKGEECEFQSKPDKAQAVGKGMKEQGSGPFPGVLGLVQGHPV